MSITGIIVEYNPFHNGHLFHLKQTKNITQSSGVIAVMSGNFTQRGEPAFVNKWARTKMALEAGVDLVIELPTIYSISSAEGFAFGAVSTLNSLGIVDSLCFGSELGNINELKIISELLYEEPKPYKNILQGYLKNGFSYPAARLKSLLDYSITSGNTSINSINVEKVLKNSNNILAIEYLKALYRLSSTITPFTIERIENRYNDSMLTGRISSATAIRNNYSNFSAVIDSIPDFTCNIMQDEILNGRGPVYLKDFSNLIFYKLRENSVDFIKNLLDVGEGLEYKIKLAAEEASDIEELISMVKNKRYTSTRIQRILLYSLLNITKEVQKQIKKTPPYIRILGFNEKGADLIRQIKASSPIKIITNPSRKDIDTIYFDMLATDIYVLSFKNKEFREAKQDLKTPPIIKPAP